MLGGVLINRCSVQNDVFLLNCSLNPLTGSCSSSNKLTTTMLMSVPMVPSLKRLETCNIGDTVVLLKYNKCHIYHLCPRLLREI